MIIMAEKEISIEEKLDNLILETKNKELIQTYYEFKLNIHKETQIIHKKLDLMLKK